MSIQGRWAVALVVTLVASLSANLLVGGWVAGRAFEAREAGFFSGAPGAPHGRAGRGVGRFLEGLPEEARPVVQAAFQARRAEIGERMRAVRAARQALVDTIARPEVTLMQIESALADLRTRQGELQAAAHTVVASAVAGLPPEVRVQWRVHWKGAP